MSTATDKLPLWYIEFRCINSWDYCTPLMYIPTQRTYVRGATEDDAKREVLAMAPNGGHITITDCLRAPAWMEKQ